MACRKAELNQAEYIVRDDMFDTFLWTLAKGGVAGMLMEYPAMRMGRLYEFFMSTFSGQNALKPSSNCKP